MADTINLGEAMRSLLKIYYSKIGGKSNYNKEIQINIIQFMNQIYDLVEKRCQCSGDRIKIYHPYKIGTKENSIGDQYKITEAPSLDDRCDEYDINFDVKKDIDYLVDLFDEFKKKVGRTHFNILEFKQTISVKKENRDTKGRGQSLNEKNDEEVLKDVVGFIDAQIFSTGMGGFLLSDKFYTEYQYRRFDRNEFVKKLKKYVQEHNIPFEGIENKEYCIAFKDAKKKANILINNAWRYIDIREKNDVVLKKIKKTVKSSRADEFDLQVKMPFYTLHSKTVDEMIVSAKGAFGEKVLQRRTDPQKRRKKYIVKQLSNDGWTYFRDVLRSFFVEYALMTNNFSNIGICANEECKKLFVMKNARGEFCDDNCKKKSYNQDPRNKCRANQNSWIQDMETKYQKPEKHFTRINYNDCKYCNETVSRGRCPYLNVMNNGEKVHPKHKKSVKQIKIGNTWIDKKN